MEVGVYSSRVMPPIQRDQLPDGTKLVTGTEVLRLSQDAVNAWQPQTDVWSLNYGSYVMGAIASASGYHVNLFYRRRLRLRGIGMFSTFIPNVVLSGLLAYRYHEKIQKDLYLEPRQCIVCFETNAALKHLLFGLALPLLASLPATMLYEAEHMTYRIPTIKHNRREFVQFCIKVFKPYRGILPFSVGAQVLAAMFISHSKFAQFTHVRDSGDFAIVAGQ